MNIILTGPRGVGKTRLVDEIIEELDQEVGGLGTVTEQHDSEVTEIRLTNMRTGEEVTMARRDGDDGPEAHGFSVDVDVINRMSKEAIEDAIRRGDLIVIDMIDQVEMHSSLFRESVRDAFRGEEDVIAIVNEDYVDEFEDEGEVIELTEDNYETVKSTILERLQSDGDST